MSDPRNVAHDKKVIHEKHKHGEALNQTPGHIPQPGKKTPHVVHKETQAEEAGDNAAENPGTKTA